MSSKEISCPHCGYERFKVAGLVGYKQVYECGAAESTEVSIEWEVDRPKYVKCFGCRRDITQYAVEQDIVAAVYKPVERDPSVTPDYFELEDD